MDLRQLSASIKTVVLVAGLVSGAVLVVRELRLLQPLELLAYDACLSARHTHAANARIALVTVTEADVLAYGWPLSDAILAQAIQAVAKGQPRAIGLDIYRDVPVPPGTSELQSVLAADARAIGIMKLGEDGSRGVRPPPVLRETQRVAFSDILVDPGGVVRRGLLFLDEGGSSFHSLSLRLALLYLAHEGIQAQPDAGDPEHLRLGKVTIHPLEPDDGGYVQADARGYQFLLDFKESDAPYVAVELKQLLTGAVESSVFRDRIVLLGVAAESVEDRFYTPISRGLGSHQALPGIAIHAQITGQLLRMALDGEAPVAVLPDWQEGLWVLLWAVAGAVLVCLVRSPWWLTILVVGGLFALVTAAFVALTAGWWIPLVPPALAWACSAGLQTGYISHRETVQRALLMQLFSRHVSREVADEIWRQRNQFSDGGRPRPQRMVVTALFTDLIGFTSVAEQHTPETLFEWLNEYMDAMAREVGGHGGVIRQYAGDAVVAIFGIPVARGTEIEIDRDARNAVACALAMEAALANLNRQWKAQGRPTTGMRIGIYTGPVISGTLGGVEHSEYVVVGDTVNTASRLESFDKTFFAPDPEHQPARILIGEPTLARVGREFATERVGEVTLKGKEQPVRIYRVINPEQPGK